MKRRPTDDEFQIIASELRELGLDSVQQSINPYTLLFNGVTCFEESDTPYGKIFTYIEDDIVDEKGNPYLFESKYLKYFGILGKGRRMISLYFDGSYCLIPANGTSYELVGAVHPDSDFDVDKGKSVKLPSPLILDLPRESVREVTAEDKKMIREAYKRYTKFTAQKIIGGIALGLLFLILIGLAYIFIASAVCDSDTSFMIVTAIALILLVASIIFTVKFTNNSHVWLALSHKYIREVMLTGAYSGEIPGFPSGVGFYVWQNGQPVYHHYNVGFACIVLRKGAGYGDRIYLLTKTRELKENDALGSGVFIQK